MDARQLAVFTADVRSQMLLIQRVTEMLEARAEGLQPEDETILRAISLRPTVSLSGSISLMDEKFREWVKKQIT